MRIRIAFAACSLVALASLATAQKPDANANPGRTPLTSNREKASYALGYNIGMSFRRDGLNVDPNLIARGVADALSNAKPNMTKEEMGAVLQAVQKGISQKMAERNAIAGQKNAKEGEAFLAKNKSAEGVKVLPSGLQYKVLKAGTGASPKATDTVRVNYHGTLVNGTVFDSTKKEGVEPAEIALNMVIQGWSEAIPLMKVGGKWQLFVPSTLAYKETSRPPVIGPNSTLIFEVELLDIVTQ